MGGGGLPARCEPLGNSSSTSFSLKQSTIKKIFLRVLKGENYLSALLIVSKNGYINDSNYF